MTGRSRDAAVGRRWLGCGRLGCGGGMWRLEVAPLLRHAVQGAHRRGQPTRCASRAAGFIANIGQSPCRQHISIRSGRNCDAGMIAGMIAGPSRLQNVAAAGSRRHACGEMAAQVSHAPPPAAQSLTWARRPLPTPRPQEGVSDQTLRLLPMMREAWCDFVHTRTDTKVCSSDLCTWIIHTILTYLKMLMAVRV